MNVSVSVSDEMPQEGPATGLLGLAERGWLPDALLRQGIRRMCAQRLRE
jgi:cyclopropane-fatty-acyl-phospholipid synthase